jgi:hypothetical protein
MSDNNPPDEDVEEYFGTPIETRPAHFVPASSEHGPVFLAEYRQSGPPPATFTITARSGDMSPKIQADLRRILSTVQIGFALLDPEHGLTEEDLAQLDRPDQSGAPAQEEEEVPPAKKLEVDFELAWKEDPRDGVTPWAFIVDPITATITGLAAYHHYHTLTGYAVKCRIWVSAGSAGLLAAGLATTVAPPNYSADRTKRDLYVDGRVLRLTTYTIYGRVYRA